MSDIDKILGLHPIKRPIFIVLAQKQSAKITFCPTNFPKEPWPQVVFAFLFTYLSAVVVYREVATKSEAAGCNFVIM